MANIQELLKKLDPKNTAHKKIIDSLNQTTDLYSKLIDDAISKKSTPDAIERIVNAIDANTDFNKEMIKTKDRRGQMPRANVFKLNAVLGATRVASTIEDFTRIEIIPINSRSDSAQKAIFVARNIDGVLESSINSIMNLTTSSDTKKAIDALTEKGKFEEGINKNLDSLYKNITEQLDKGIGTRYQLLTYNRDKAREQIEKITQLFKSGKSTEEISEELKISIAGIDTIKNEVNASIDNDLIESNKALIKKHIEAKKTYKEIADEINVNITRLSNYCRNNGLLEYDEKRYIKDNLEKIETLLNEGKTFDEIAQTLSVNRTRLESISRNNKLSEKTEKKADEKAS